MKLLFRLLLLVGIIIVSLLAFNIITDDDSNGVSNAIVSMDNQGLIKRNNELERDNEKLLIELEKAKQENVELKTKLAEKEIHITELTNMYDMEVIESEIREMGLTTVCTINTTVGEGILIDNWAPGNTDGHFEGKYEIVAYFDHSKVIIDDSNINLSTQWISFSEPSLLNELTCATTNDGWFTRDLTYQELLQIQNKADRVVKESAMEHFNEIKKYVVNSLQLKYENYEIKFID